MNRAARFLAVVLCLVAPALRAQKPEPFWIDEALFSLPGSLDPHAVFFPEWNRIFRLSYETPLTCDPGSERLEIVPHLLAELPALSEDGKTMTLKFRKGIRFHDDPCFPGGKGRELVANDFIDTIKRHADPTSSSVYYPAYLADRIVGLDAARAKAIEHGFWDNEVEIAGLTAKSDLEVRIELTRPYPHLVALMTMSWMSIIPREASQRYGSGLSRRTVGTGPYRFDRDASDEAKMIFRAVPKYWNAAAGGSRPLPRNAGVRFHLLGDVDLQEKRFALGDLTVLELFPNTMDRFVNARGDVLRKAAPKGTKLLTSDRAWVHYIAFNFRNKILGKKKVRQALALAVDRKRYLQEYYNGAGVLADHPVPPSLRVDIPDMPWKYGGHDLEKARRLLAEAGYPKGAGLPEFVVDMPSNDALSAAEGKILEESWAKLGVRVQIRHQEWDSFIKRIRNGSTEISVNFWFADFPDAENFMFMLHSSKAPVAGESIDAPNTGFWSNDDYDALYDRSTLLLPGKERGKIYREMIEIVQEECPWIFVVHQSALSLLAAGVEGMNVRSYFSWDYARLHRTSFQK